MSIPMQTESPTLSSECDPLGPWSTARCLRWSIVTILTIGLFGPSLWNSLKPPQYAVLDFYQEWSSAKNVIEGIDVYASLDVTVERYLGFHKKPGAEWYWDVNVHPPSSVLLAMPFVGLDYWNAFLVWNVISLGLLGISGGLIVRGRSIHLSLWSWLPIAVILLICEPLQQQVIQGQLNLVLLVLIVSCWYCSRTDRPGWAGMFLGVAAVIKLFPAFLFLYFVMRKDGKALFYGAITVVAVTALTMGVMGVDSYVDYGRHILPKAAQWKATFNNASIAGFWHKLFDPATRHGRTIPVYFSPSVAKMGTITSWLIVIALVARCVWSARTRIDQDRAFGLAIVGMLLVSPVTWEHYFLLLIPALVFVWIDLPRSRWVRTAFIGILVALCLPIIMLTDIIVPGGFVQGVAQPWHTLTILSLQFYALAGLFFLGLRLHIDSTAACATTRIGSQDRQECATAI